MPAPPTAPLALLQRTGYLGPDADSGAYEALSAGVAELIRAMLPLGWKWSGRRVLDFGCGAGRVMGQFAAEAEVAELTGCDIHAPSIEWLRQNLSPPFHAFVCGETPGLPQPNGHFDLIYAMSVYTHLTDHWAGWLLEHHRVLADDGLLLVSFLGEGMIEPLIGEPWDDTRIGMNALWAGNPWDRGGPMVFHSPWWLEAHWGRLFEIVKLLPHTGEEAPEGHGLVLLRRKPVRLTEEQLAAPEPGEPRELTAALHLADQLRQETLGLRAENARLRASASWRLTRPLRAAKHAVQRRHRGG